MKYEKLRPNFYSAHLYIGEINLKVNHTAHFFFIVEHSNNKEFIHKQALELLVPQCKWFEFYGRYRNEWELGFDEIDIMLHPNDEDEDIALTSSWNDIESFVDTLKFTLSTRSIVPCDIYLLYDDENIYKDVLNRLSVLYHKRSIQD